MRKIKFLFLALFLLLPFSSADACSVRQPAKSYINRIHKIIGGEKPKLVIESGKDKEIAAFYDGKAIHIYKGDYKGSCGNETPYLKSVIAHEYAHHAEKKFKSVAKLKGEKLAYVAEHAIGDSIFGDDIEYDNDKDLKHPKAYEAITKMIFKKQSKKNDFAKNNTLYFKKHRSNK
ncbi:MAG TPA: hypothetical protein P5323_04380 [Candidatus Moranbacteria bacterium]|nr:hypothetical protein [Candidatus Moranbacteria bacterium]HRY28344.1 hypothetical protein [Candidatus Moranbacteria bacterium]HSA07936.1 hypothetical protein [Candidatus Moranbacteria bacterium]